MSPPRPLELVRLSADHLAARGVEDARLDAELLLAHVLGIRRLDLYLQFERPLGADEVAAYREAIRRRSRREPLQHITGEAAFRELTLTVDPRVLIPRPETEILVGEVLKWATGRREEVGRDLRALDLGTGSGAIALSLLREGPFATVVATDVSEGALEVVAANADRAGVPRDTAAGAARQDNGRRADGAVASVAAPGNVELRQGSLWNAVGEGERFDVIVSNPPYVAEADRGTLEPEVVDYEPASALFAGPDGLAVLREISAGAATRLLPGGLLAVEVGAGQADTVVEWLRAGGFETPRVVEDLAGRERVVLAARAGGADRENEGT